MRMTFSTLVTPTRESDTRTAGADACTSGTRDSSICPRVLLARYARIMAAGIVLAGGHSSRMGTPKAWLDWHGTTLLRRTCAVVARGVAGPVVVVRRAGTGTPRVARRGARRRGRARGQGATTGAPRRPRGGRCRGGVRRVDRNAVPAPALRRRGGRARRATPSRASPASTASPSRWPPRTRTALAPLVEELVEAGSDRPASFSSAATCAGWTTCPIPRACATSTSARLRSRALRAEAACARARLRKRPRSDCRRGGSGGRRQARRRGRPARAARRGRRDRAQELVYSSAAPLALNQ